MSKVKSANELTVEIVKWTYKYMSDVNGNIFCLADRDNRKRVDLIEYRETFLGRKKSIPCEYREL